MHQGTQEATRPIPITFNNPPASEKVINSDNAHHNHYCHDHDNLVDDCVPRLRNAGDAGDADDADDANDADDDDDADDADDAEDAKDAEDLQAYLQGL